MFFWKSKDVVREEKLIFKNTYDYGSIESNAALTVTVFAAPENPQNITGFSNFTIYSKSHAYLVVSTVGTRIEPNFLSAGGEYSLTLLSQLCS